MDINENYGIWHKGFHVTVGDEPEYEDLTAEITFDDKLIAHLTQDNGFERMQIELYGEGDHVVFACRLDDLIEAISREKNRLWELRRRDGQS